MKKIANTRSVIFFLTPGLYAQNTRFSAAGTTVPQGIKFGSGTENMLKRF